MIEDVYVVFWNMLDRIIAEEGPWQEKAEALRASASERDLVNLAELASWCESLDLPS